MGRQNTSSAGEVVEGSRSCGSPGFKRCMSLRIDIWMEEMKCLWSDKAVRLCISFPSFWAELVS
jgi:hypothetical protein